VRFVVPIDLDLSFFFPSLSSYERKNLALKKNAFHAFPNRHVTLLLNCYSVFDSLAVERVTSTLPVYYENEPSHMKFMYFFY
jgi:hypothetical protein